MERFLFNGKILYKKIDNRKKKNEIIKLRKLLKTNKNERLNKK